VLLFRKPMPPRFKLSEESEHPPAMSGTPTAWRTLVLLALLIAGWVFFKPVCGEAIRLGLSAAAWCRGGELHIYQLALADNGWIQARGITWFFGPPEHRSYIKTDWAEVRRCSLMDLLHTAEGEPRRLLWEVRTGKTKALLDSRAGSGTGPSSTSNSVRANDGFLHPTIFLPSSSVSIGSTDVVLIGDQQRLEIKDLILRLPDRWTGRISYSEGSVDIGSWHQLIPKASAPAFWEGGVLRLGDLDLGHEFLFREISIHPTDNGFDFGVQGHVGHGILRGDGSFGTMKNVRNLELTLVGEGLELGSFREWMRDEKKATGSISQARLTFRGNPADPLNADCSLRLVARDFRWDGRGWDSLRLAAALTGRNLTLSELSLRQQENEVTASGQSHLPSDWHEVVRAPFTARFHAELEDAGALSGLAGPGFTQLAGGLQFEGEVQGSENKAAGYCNLTGTGLIIRKLPLDWVKGCLIFAGDQTRLTSLEAWSGHDHVVLSGIVANSMPHDYKAEAEADVRDLTKRLAQLGVVTAATIGGGGVKFHWQGAGNTAAHHGAFQTQVEGWVSKWTTTGMSGKFEGVYAPGKVEFSKAEFKQEDLSLALKLSATTNNFQASDIIATKEGKPFPLVKGDVALPFNAPRFWQSGEVLTNIAMDGTLAVNLALQGIKAEEIASLFGQEIPFVGTLEGSVSAKGTIAKPDLQVAVGIRNFSPKKGGETADLSVSLDATDGKAKAKLLQQPASTSPLSVELEMPLRLINDRGTLQLGDVDQPIRGTATFQQVPLDGWASLARLDAWPLEKARVGGKINLSGSWKQPILEGGLVLVAEKGHLFGNHTLEHLSLPITLSTKKAVFGPGSALYRDKPVTLSGDIAWENPSWKGGLRLMGKDLPMTLGGGLEAMADADLVLGAEEQTPVLRGSMALHRFMGALKPDLTPGFAPPACLLNLPGRDSSEDPALEAGLKNLHLDLSLRSDGMVPLHPQTNTSVALEVKAGGPAHDPSLSGTIEGKNVELTLPCGPFVVPHARMHLEATRYTLSGDDAYGLTKNGFCGLELSGGLTNPKVAFEGAPGVTAPDLLLAMTSGRAEQSKRLLTQGAAWCRQNMLFPLPAKNWMTSRMGDNEPGALGFYGAPWIWNFSWGGKPQQ